MNNSALFAGLVVVLGFLCKVAGDTCIDCASGEESVLLQRTVSSHNETALGPQPWNWFKPGYYRQKKSRCVEDVEAIQKEWKEAILDISAAYRADPESSDYVQLAEDAINLLYGYDIDEVLFKPTLAVEEPFRPTFIGALSYFVGYSATQNRGGFPEDTGFAIASLATPGRRSCFSTTSSVAREIWRLPKATTTSRISTLRLRQGSSTVSCTRSMTESGRSWCTTPRCPPQYPLNLQMPTWCRKWQKRNPCSS